MGQGYSLTSISAGAAALDASELSDLTYEKSLGTARFMKTIRARRDDGVVVAKLAMKPVQNQNWDRYVKTLIGERKQLAEVPNALGHHRIQQTSTTGILTRQFIHSSLYDRISTRPFLDLIEKRWLAYQLLCAVRDSHARSIYHGDIKTENVLVTSWNWLYLTDFSSSYKPTYLPEDNPADFSFYFDTSGRRTCYLAPERFLRSGEDFVSKGTMNWSMDIFSVGCVIAELFLETPIFSLSQLLRYRANEYDPQAALDDIKDPDIREMIAHMIQLDPQARYAADEYLNFWRSKAFPDYFSSFLHQYMYHITDPTSGRRPITSGHENLGEADDRIDRVYNDFDKIAYFLGYEENSKTEKKSRSKPAVNPNDLFPLQVDIPNHRHTISSSADKPSDNGSLLFLTLVEASLRSTARASPRMKAIELLLAFAERVPDEVKLDRILPYLMDMLNEDQTEPVRIYALRATTQLLELVQTITAQNAYVFTEYILPRIRIHVIAPRKNPSTALRATYASCLASLATTALRFLDMMQALRLGGTALAGDPENSASQLSFTALTQLYDNNRADLMGYFEDHTTGLLEDTETSVRRAFLGSIATLCYAFGSAKASDVVLSHLNTYLNDRDWQLKCAFFETIVGVAVYVGGSALEEFILPLMVQALTDPEETVVERVLRSFSSIAQLGLFQRPTLWELVEIVARFTMHPSTYIREAASFLISSATKFLSVADRHGIVIPLIKAYLKFLPTEFTELVLLDALKKPLPRVVFDYAILWAQKTTDKGTFWKVAQMQHTFMFGAGQHVLPNMSGKELGPRALSRIPQSDEDHVWLGRLRSAGMSGDDEFKLVALREFIVRVANRRVQEEAAGDPSKINPLITISELNIMPRIVVFDKEEDVYNQEMAAHGEAMRRRTIAEALQDARDDRLQGRPGPITLPRPSYGGEGDSGASTPAGIDIPTPRGLRSPTSGPQIACSADSRPSMRSEHKYNLRRKGSSISLIGGGKAKAETGTTAENAVGRVETSSTNRDNSSRQSTPLQADHRRSSSHPRIRSSHNYTGSDPTLLRLIEAMDLEKYPIDLYEFGPMVARRQAIPIKRVGGQAPNTPWRPDGNLVAMLSEHTAGVNRIAVAPDHMFFVTGSDDGTVKIWDTYRLERNVTNRSRQTHKQGDGVKVTSLTFIEDTHCFVSTGSDGSVQIVRVDYQIKEDTANGASGRYGRLRIIREHYLVDGEYVTWCEHFRDDHKSILMLSTNKCRILALDLRTMETIYELRNPVQHGIPLCFCVDKKRKWLVVGTTHGVLDLWDLRFRIRIKAYSFGGGGAPIHRVSLLPTLRPKSKQLRIAVAGGTGQPEITIWDIERLNCTNVYRTGSGGAKEASRSYKLAEIDEDKSGGMLSRFATTTAKSEHGTVSAGLLGSSIRAFALGMNTWEGSEGPRYHFFLSAGPDWKVRYWDTSRPEASTVVSGMELEEGRPSYTVSQPSPELQVVSERLNPATAAVSSSAGGGDPGKKERKSRSSVISMQAQVLLKTHLDMVVDVAFLEVPYGMVVSADRAGVVYVFS